MFKQKICNYGQSDLYDLGISWIKHNTSYQRHQKLNQQTIGDMTISYVIVYNINNKLTRYEITEKANADSVIISSPDLVEVVYNG